MKGACCSCEAEPVKLIDEKVEAEVAKIEKQIAQLKEKMAKLRKKHAPKAVEDYELKGHDGKTLRLSQAFGKKKDLIVVHNMGSFCSYCTLWADEMNGVIGHLEDRTAFLVVSPDDVKTQKAVKKARGWKFAMASAKDTDFTKDMGFEPKPGEFWPGATSFRKGPGGRVERVARTFFGPGDDFCGVWHYFDLLADGVNNWQPKKSY